MPRPEKTMMLTQIPKWLQIAYLTRDKSPEFTEAFFKDLNAAIIKGNIENPSRCIKGLTLKMIELDQRNVELEILVNTLTLRLNRLERKSRRDERS